MNDDAKRLQDLDFGEGLVQWLLRAARKRARPTPATEQQPSKERNRGKKEKKKKNEQQELQEWDGPLLPPVTITNEAAIAAIRSHGSYSCTIKIAGLAYRPYKVENRQRIVLACPIMTVIAGRHA